MGQLRFEVIGDYIYLDGQVVAVIVTSRGTTLDRTFRSGLDRLVKVPPSVPPIR